MIDIQSHKEGATIPVRAQAGARQNAIRGEQDGALKISVSQAPEQGKANKAIIAVLSKALKVRKSDVTLMAGAASNKKRFLIRDVTVDELRANVNDVLAQGRS